MNSDRKRILLTIGVLMSLGLGLYTHAQAAFVLEEVTTIWENPVGSGPFSLLGNEIEWGNLNPDATGDFGGKSRLVSDPLIPPSVGPVSVGQRIDIANITHRNANLSPPASLQGIDLRLTLGFDGDRTSEAIYRFAINETPDQNGVNDPSGQTPDTITNTDVIPTTGSIDGLSFDYNRLDPISTLEGQTSPAPNSISLNVTAVPIPGAVWLMGSGIVALWGLFGFRRRRNGSV